MSVATSLAFGTRFIDQFKEGLSEGSAFITDRDHLKLVAACICGGACSRASVAGIRRGAAVGLCAGVIAASPAAATAATCCQKQYTE